MVRSPRAHRHQEGPGRFRHTTEFAQTCPDQSDVMPCRPRHRRRHRGGRPGGTRSRLRQLLPGLYAYCQSLSPNPPTRRTPSRTRSSSPRGSCPRSAIRTGSALALRGGPQRVPPAIRSAGSAAPLDEASGVTDDTTDLGAWPWNRRSSARWCPAASGPCPDRGRLARGRGPAAGGRAAGGPARPGGFPRPLDPPSPVRLHHLTHGAAYARGRSRRRGRDRRRSPRRRRPAAPSRTGPPWRRPRAACEQCAARCRLTLGPRPAPRPGRAAARPPPRPRPPRPQYRPWSQAA